MTTRWGIVSAGKICHDFVTALSTISCDEHKVVAVAAREIARAQTFAEQHKIPKAYGTYQELANDEEVDIAYVGVINTQHFNVSKLMLNCGKPVLCEKPLGLNLNQTKELIELSKQNSVFLMEGIWTRCFPIYEILRKELESGGLGEIVQVQANAGFCNAEVERIKMKDLGGGSISDIGIYVLQIASLAFGVRKPKDIVAVGSLNDQGVDQNMGCIFTYDCGETAILSTHSKAQFPNDAVIIGTNGIASLPGPFWCPTQLTILNKTYDSPLPRASQEFNYINAAGLRYEAMEVRRCLQDGLLESPKVTHEECLLLAELQDILRQKVGVQYNIE